MVSYNQIAEKNYSLSAGQYFDVKIEYTDITPALLKIDLSNYGYARHFKFLKQSKILLPNSIISWKFEKIAAKSYSMIRENIFQNQQLTQLRDWLLPMLMNGQITIK